MKVFHASLPYIYHIRYIVLQLLAYAAILLIFTKA
jgi:hypothetical protein